MNNEDGPADGFGAFIDIVRRLRGEGGCPWDREQTHGSLKPYLIEEAYEAVEAIDGGEADKLCEELGDVLLQVVLHAVIAEEEGSFGIAEVVAGIGEKMIRRHPHVFAGVKVTDSAEVLRRWDQIKRGEKAGQGVGPNVGEKESGETSGETAGPARAKVPGLLSGIPRQMPALMAAAKAQERAARFGFEWADVSGALEKAKEELAELALEYRREDTVRIGDEIGDLIFAVVSLARFAGVDPEEALRRTTNKFAVRFSAIEEEAGKAGRRVEDLGRTELLKLWRMAKGNVGRRGDGFEQD